MVRFQLIPRKAEAHFLIEMGFFVAISYYFKKKSISRLVHMFPNLFIKY